MDTLLQIKSSTMLNVFTPNAGEVAHSPGTNETNNSHAMYSIKTREDIHPSPALSF